MSLCRELTKKHEEVFRTTISQALEHFRRQPPKGECVLVIRGRDPREAREEEVRAWEEISLEEHMERYLGQGMDRKEAMKQVARDRGVSKRDIYRQLL